MGFISKDKVKYLAATMAAAALTAGVGALAQDVPLLATILTPGLIHDAIMSIFGLGAVAVTAHTAMDWRTATPRDAELEAARAILAKQSTSAQAPRSAAP